MDRRAPREFLFCLRRSARGRKQIADANSTRRAGVLRARPPAGGVGTVMVTPEANGGTCSTRTGLQRSAHPIPMGAASVGAGNPPPPPPSATCWSLRCPHPRCWQLLHCAPSAHSSPLPPDLSPFPLRSTNSRTFPPPRAIFSPPRIPAGRGSRPPSPPTPPSAEGRGCGVWDKRTGFGELGFCARPDTASQRSSPRSCHITHEWLRF